MNEVKSCVWQRVSNNIVLKHLDVWRGQRLQKRRIDVRDEDVSRGSHTIREPRRDRASTSPDLQAPPALAYPAVLQMTDCATIKHARQSVEPGGCFPTGVIQSVGETIRALWTRAFVSGHSTS